MCGYSGEQTVRLDPARAGEPRKGERRREARRVAMVGRGLQMQFEIEEASAGLRRSNCSALAMFLPELSAPAAITLAARAPETIALVTIALEHASGGSRRRMGDGE
jgi:hypothetical protein